MYTKNAFDLLINSSKCGFADKQNTNMNNIRSKKKMNTFFASLDSFSSMFTALNQRYNQRFIHFQLTSVQSHCHNFSTSHLKVYHEKNMEYHIYCAKQKKTKRSILVLRFHEGKQIDGQKEKAKHKRHTKW